MTAIQTATQQIAATLRLHIASLGAPSSAAKRKGRSSSVSGGAKDGPDAAQPTPDFAERIALRVQGIARDDPLFKRKVLRIFLETVISAELGVSLQNDVRFSTMIDSVQSQMESDPDIGSAIESAFTALVDNSGKE